MFVTADMIGSEPAPMRWSADQYLALVESGVIEEGRGVELIDGQVISAMPQGKLHNFIFIALQMAFKVTDTGQRTLAAQTTVVLRDDNVFDPEFALLRAEYDRRNLPTAVDVEWVVEISVSSRSIDLGPKKAAYAAASIPEYWVVDAVRRGIWTFSQPQDGAYLSEAFVPAGESVDLPFFGSRLDTNSIFPGEVSP